MSPPPLWREIGQAVRRVQDPEMGIGIADLGLVYGAEVLCGGESGCRVVVRMSLTSPACPYGPMILASMREALCAIPGVSEAKVEMAFEPMWDPLTMASEEAKDRLGIF
jgi:metal-sulfur cluster biosynthetic enzyme